MKKDENIFDVLAEAGYATKMGSKHWDPTEGRSPFKVMSGIGEFDNVQQGMIKKSERDAQAPKIMPFPLDRITDQLVDVYEHLMIARQTLTTTIRTALLNNQEKAVLRLNVKKIDRCVKWIKEVSADVERIHL